MRRPLILGFALTSLLVLTGCVGSQELTTPSETLQDVNRKLEGRKATLSFVGGDIEKRATSVKVGREFVTYRTQGARDGRRPTSELSQITITAGNGGLIGLVAGAVPGILVAVAPYRCPEESGMACGIGAGLFKALGAVGAVVGGVAWGIVGARLDNTYVIYFGPVERYGVP
ncbi:MAG: hypothetical protein ACR2GR_04195 [Rhodothermales bacterium]